MFAKVTGWFDEGNEVDVWFQSANDEYEKNLRSVNSLESTVKSLRNKLHGDNLLLWMEFLLHGLAEFSQISKLQLASGLQFKDLMGSMMNFRHEKDSEE